MGSVARPSGVQLALGAALRGYRVFPVDAGKVPLVKDWPERATNVARVISTWWRRWPDAQAGIVCDAGLVVVDLDVKNGHEGITTWGQWCAQHELPVSLHVATPSGGAHIYFRSDAPLTNRAGVLPGVDVRAGRGYVIAYQLPPSREQLVELPALAVELLASTPASEEGTKDDGGVEATEASHGYALRAVEAELARLDELDLLGWAGPGWNQTTFEAACNLIELAQSSWADLDLDEVREQFDERAPRDGEGFEPATCWASATARVGDQGRAWPHALDERSSPQDDFGDLELPPLDAPECPYAALWAATPTLAHIRAAAHARMLSAPALLCYMLCRAIVELPPSVGLPPTIGSRASLNLGVAVVGPSGAGKSALLSTSRELLGFAGADQLELEKPVGSGEGLVMSFLRWDKGSPDTDEAPGRPAGLVMADDPRRILVADEIDQLGATQARSGASLAPTLRSALTGGQIGQANATAERNRQVPEGSYRLALIVGVQPTRSGVLLDDTDAGTPQRLVWVSAVDPSLPDEDVAWPGPLDLDDMGSVEGDVTYPEHVAREIRAARRKVAREGAAPLEGHLLLLRLKLATGLARLHGQAHITEQWWTLSDVLARGSLGVQASCKSALALAAAETSRAQGRADYTREIGRSEAADRSVESLARTITANVGRHKDTGGVRGRGGKPLHEPRTPCLPACISRAAQHRPQLRDDALALALSRDWLVEQTGRYVIGELAP